MTIRSRYKAALIALVLAAVGVGIWATLTYTGGTPVVSAQALGERAKAERDSLIASLASGKALYFRIESYNLGESAVEETWMVLGENNEVTRTVTQSRNSEGTLVATGDSSGGVFTHTDHVTGEVMTMADDVTYSAEDWVSSAWTAVETLQSRGLTYLSAGTLDGKTSAIFETTSSTPDDDYGPAANYRHRIEVAVDAPLIHRQFIYKVDGETETLVSSLALTSYEVRAGSDAPAS